MSPRTFARRFKEATGTTPHAWLLTQRLDLAEELLETTGLTVEEIAQQVGYRTATVLRAQFVKRRGMLPSAYRSIVDRRIAARQMAGQPQTHDTRRRCGGGAKNPVRARCPSAAR